MPAVHYLLCVTSRSSLAILEPQLPRNVHALTWPIYTYAVLESFLCSSAHRGASARIELSVDTIARRTNNAPHSFPYTRAHPQNSIEELTRSLLDVRANPLFTIGACLQLSRLITYSWPDGNDVTGTHHSLRAVRTRCHLLSRFVAVRFDLGWHRAGAKLVCQHATANSKQILRSRKLNYNRIYLN